MNTTFSNENCGIDYLSIGSYILNAILLIATIYSELAGISKCKSHNGIIDGVTKVIDRVASQANIDLEEGVEMTEKKIMYIYNVSNNINNNSLRALKKKL